MINMYTHTYIGHNTGPDSRLVQLELYHVHATFCLQIQGCLRDIDACKIQTTY